MLFKVTNKDNKSNIIFIQGAYSRGTSNDISGITLQNYDEDSKKVFSMASIMARDAFGSADSIVEGELLFSTNVDGSNLQEAMRLKYDGSLCIGSNIPFPNSLVSVYGGISVTSNAYLMNNVFVNSNATFSNNVNVLNTLIVGSDVTFSNNLQVLKNTSIFGGLTVSSNVLMSSDVSVQRSLVVSSNTTLCNDARILTNLSVGSNITASNDLLIYGNASIGLGTTLATTTIAGIATLTSQQSNTAFTVNQKGTGVLFQLQQSNQAKVTVRNDGLVGIGTTSPTKLLHVNGDINFDGMIYQNGVIFPREPLVHTFSKTNTSSKDYKVVLSWVNDLSFSNVRNLRSIVTKSYVLPGYRDTTSNLSYSLRVYDLTNNSILAQSTFSNQSPALVTMTLSNLRINTQTELELQGKVNTGSNLVIESMLFRYN
jgi:acetyltransferase-like isoleucine patch superfamily enzyme